MSLSWASMKSIAPIRGGRTLYFRQCMRETSSTAVALPRRKLFSTSHWRCRDPVEEPDFISLVDRPPQLVRSGRKHGPGLILLALIPITAFALGTWQVQRLRWKSDLLAKLEDRLVREPLPLPPQVDASAVPDFDYRRVRVRGRFRHDLEMLVGPRMRDGQQGYHVVTPLERDDGDGGIATVLVCRGWIPKRFRDRRSRPASLERGEVEVEGLLREPFKKNMFTPDNRPDKGEFYFPDVEQMARLSGSQPIWIEATQEPEYFQMADYEARGIPIGRAAEVSLRNNHAQYIFTWYSLCLATSVMLYMVMKKPPTDVARRVRQSRHWS